MDDSMSLEVETNLVPFTMPGSLAQSMNLRE